MIPITVSARGPLTGIRENMQEQEILTLVIMLLVLLFNLQRTVI